MVDRDPLGALRVIREVMAQARDLDGFLATLKDAQARSVTATELLQNRRTKAMLTQDRKTGRLPAELRGRLLKGEYAQ